MPRSRATIILAGSGLVLLLVGGILAWRNTIPSDAVASESNSAARADHVRDRDALAVSSRSPALDPAVYIAPSSTPATPLVDASAIDFDRDILTFFESHCLECHAEESQEGELDLKSTLAAHPLVRNRELWLKVSQYVEMGAMPPSESEQPSSEERATLVAWVDHMLSTFDYETVKSPGFEPARRLSHHEYDATIRDLLGLDLRPAEKFPNDSSGTSGFDNSANTLFLQPLLLERYFAAAEEVLSAAMAGPTIASPVLAELVGLMPAGDVDPTNERDRAAAVFEKFLLHAFRRPPTEDELTRVVDNYLQQRESGSTVTSALQTTLSVVLVSPHFLMRVESSASEAEYRISDWDLASRLSYFIWASMPDERLFTLAQQGRLSDPDVLAAEVDRLLDDPRADTLGTIFAAQWLGFQHIGTRVRLNPTDNPWCTETLMQAMRGESSMFFNSLVRENQPLARLIDADYTYLNEELARHYRIRFVHGDELRRVELKNDERGGIFGQASLLAITSFPDRTSPVVRGKWILADVLGTPPPPPPPNVGTLEQVVEEGEVLTLREELERHRNLSECAICHDQIDPLGLSLEHYDNFGRWRRSTEAGRIDARGQLPNGTQFDDLSGLRRVVLEQRMDDLARQITSKMLAYALGRQIEYYDESAIREILQQFDQHDHRLRSLIHAIVNSYPFQYKRIPSPT